MKLRFLTNALIIFLMFGCNQEKQEASSEVNKNTQKNKAQLEAIFPRGNLGSDKYFTGKAYNYGLVSMDSTYTTLVGNVYFEPGARSNWHTHPAGQILIITDGIGYHQIEGRQVDTIRKGDVVKCPPNVRHWHGASASTGMQQIYIVPNTEKGVVEWMEPVTDDQYPGGANKNG